MTEQQPEAITEAELAEALREMNITAGSASTFYPAVAEAIFGHVRRRREPEPVYAIGDLFEDAAGKQWYRVGGDLPWRHVPTSQHHREERPVRPLRRLVPEGSPLSDSERDLVHADLGKLLDLLGLGDYARPESSHEVFLTCLEEVAKLKGLQR